MSEYEEDDQARHDAHAIYSWMQHLRELLAIVAEAFGNPMTASMIGPKLTCSEAESLAELLRFAAFGQAADMLVWCHSESDDDPNDEHYQMPKPANLLELGGED